LNLEDLIFFFVYHLLGFLPTMAKGKPLIQQAMLLSVYFPLFPKASLTNLQALFRTAKCLRI